ncbi:MAG: zinc metallopeptidase [Lachnospiraceae bacterium]|nr:zinc metallopeptidase [Lachnospiraceae bacterium]
MYLGGWGNGMYLMWDSTYILVLVGVVLSLLASAKVRSTFGRYSQVRSASGMTGAQTAERILSYAGIRDVEITHISGQLNDHYNPKTKVVALSDSVYGSNSLAAIAVAAHECGHVIQHHKNYAPLSVRTALVPVANFGSGASWIIIIAGIIFSFPSLITVGIVCFSLAVLFQVITLPVEFNASRRALVILQDTGILGNNEGKAAGKVLRAAALTYVAAAAASILQLLRLILLFGRNRND